MDFEDIILNEVSQREGISYTCNLKRLNSETENSMEVEEMGNAGKGINFHLKEFRGSNVQHEGTITDNTVLHT